jgi:MAP7 domain-containing protein 1
MEIAGGRVKTIREPSEGYDELEAIPHSFAVEFIDDGPWCFFADTAEDKVGGMMPI